MQLEVAAEKLDTFFQQSWSLIYTRVVVIKVISCAQPTREFHFYFLSPAPNLISIGW